MKKIYLTEESATRAYWRSRMDKFKNRLKLKPTKEELIVLSFLIENGIYFKFQKGFVKPFTRIVDFYLPKPFKTIIEIDGGYHINTHKKDARKDFVWGNLGYKTIRISNEDVNSGRYKEILEQFIVE